MNDEMIIRRDFDNSEHLAAQLAAQIAFDLKNAITLKGKATLAVSGGSTPKKMFAELSQCQLDWSMVTIVPVDERWVDETNDRSNGRLIKQNLMQNEAQNTQFVPLFGGEADPHEGLDAVHKRVAPLLPLDVAILGMGTDGHTASFFPNGDQLAEAIDLNSDALVSPMAAPGAGEPRMTLTLAPLLNADKLYLHIEGQEKLDVLEQASGYGAVEDMPIRAVLRQLKKPLNIYTCG